MPVINLTPHAVVVVAPSGEVVARYDSAGEARADQSDAPAGTLEDGTPLLRVTFGEVTGLPDPAPGVRYIVSIVTANAARAQGRGTDDLLVPSGVVRDDDGNRVGCRALALV